MLYSWEGFIRPRNPTGNRRITDFCALFPLKHLHPLKQARYQHGQYALEVAIVTCFRSVLKVDSGHLLSMLFSLTVSTQMISSLSLLLSNLPFVKLIVINAITASSNSKEWKTVYTENKIKILYSAHHLGCKPSLSLGVWRFEFHTGTGQQMMHS